MKMISLLLFFSAGLLAQSATADWALNTGGVSGSTLTDQSGNGNNGTLVGSPTVSSGYISFDGATQYATIPNLIGNSDFTVMLWLQGQGGNYAFAEDSTTSTSEVGMYASGTAKIAGTGWFVTTNTPAALQYTSEFHCYYMKRSGNGIEFGLVDNPVRISNTISTNVVGATVAAALGARIRSATAELFWGPGKMARAQIYLTALSTDRMRSIYAGLQPTLSALGVYMADVVDLPTSGPVWKREGVIIKPQAGDGNYIAEPSAIWRTNDCQIIANPCMGLWYTAGSAGVRYTESADGITNWATPVVALAGYNMSYVIRNGSAYRMYANRATISNRYDVFSSADGVTWASVTTDILPVGAGGTWDHTLVGNMSVVQVDSTHWYAAYEGQGTNPSGATGAHCGAATSSDGLAWTKVASNPISGYTIPCQGPDLHYIGGQWYIWGH